MKNRRTIVWLLFAVLLLAGANVWLSVGKRDELALSQRVSLLAASDDSVSMLVFERPGEPATVLAKAGAWRLVEPFSGSVDEQTVLKLIDTLVFGPIDDVLSDQELLRLGRTRADFGLDAPALTVRIRHGGAETAISFGSETPSRRGVYASVAGVGAVFVVSRAMHAAVDVRTDGFRRRSLFSVGAAEVVLLDIKRHGDSFLRFQKEGDVWQMVQPMQTPASSQRIRNLLTDITSAQVKDFVWPRDSADAGAGATAALLTGYGLDPDAAVSVSFKSTDGMENRISFGADATDGCVYALVHSGAAVVTVPKTLKDQSVAETSLFADTRLFPYEAAQLTSVSVSDGGLVCLLAKEPNGTWRMDAPVVAPADVAAVEALISAVLELRSADLATNGVEISVSADPKTVSVSREALPSGFRARNLRSTDILSMKAASVKRISVTHAEAEKPTAVVYDADRRAWNVESSPMQGTVSSAGVDKLLAAIDPLRAVRIVKLKVGANDLRDYGLEAPRLIVAVDPRRDDAVRRNILVGNPTEGGHFATIGVSDAVFVLSAETVEALSSALVEE